jgi:hypothetical protein
MQIRATHVANSPVYHAIVILYRPHRDVRHPLFLTHPDQTIAWVHRTGSILRYVVQKFAYYWYQGVRALAFEH